MDFATLNLDTYKVVKLLQTKGFSEDQAEAFIEAVQEITLSGVATRQDIKDIKVDFKDLGNEIQEARGDIQSNRLDIQDIRGELKLLKWMLGFSLAMSVAILLKMFGI
jgi:DNA gyrase/topoisomerase IV subunit A